MERDEQKKRRGEDIMVEAMVRTGRGFEVVLYCDDLRRTSRSNESFLRRLTSPETNESLLL